MSFGLIVIGGATGAGKTALAVRVAQSLGGEVISADSRQIYRDFTIGTAKPTIVEQQGVPHHLLDCIDPRVTYTVAQYQGAAQSIIATLQQQRKIPILCGGTGLYVDAVTMGLEIPQVAPNPILRAELAQTSTSELYERVHSHAPLIHANDRVRLLRALEIITTLGHLPARTLQPPPYPILWIGLECPDANQFTQRLTARAQGMVEQGWLPEVAQLQVTYGPQLPLLETLGYAQMMAHLAGKCSLNEALQETVIRTRQYAKRQRTWFRRYGAMHWLNSQQLSLEQLTEQVLNLFRK